ncbi:MAG TPA: nucleotidyltransferase domain-containing protein [Candidatus Hydrogenedentes bacterium]|nr:nucleotidyltransferase domain-containing protein [Candidatus Hydrogenedentota bacterium]
MIDESIVNCIKEYLRKLPAHGIHARRAILFGSYARGEANQWSDIDLIVLAPEFDRKYKLSTLQTLWRARGKDTIRIEPIPCGEQQWETDETLPILEIARREGIEISV